MQTDPREHGYFKTSSQRGHLQSLTGRSLRVDGEGELVDEDNNQKNQSDGDGGQDNVPASLGTPLLEPGGGSKRRGDRGGECAARAIVAVLVVSLEGVGEADETQEGDDDGGQGQEDKSQEDEAGQGHAEGEDDLVADGVKDEDKEESGDNEGKDQADQNESLGELDSCVHLGHSSAGVLGAGGGGDGIVSALDLGSDSVKIVEHLAGVELLIGDGGRAGSAGGHGVEGGVPRIPAGAEAGNGQAKDNGCESDTAKILLLI